MVKKYTPFLDEIGLTYTQYIVMMVLWEWETGVFVRAVGDFAGRRERVFWRNHRSGNSVNAVLRRLPFMVNGGLVTGKKFNIEIGSETSVYQGVYTVVVCNKI
jgi:hypothetical protein